MNIIEKGSVTYERFDTSLGIEYSNYASKILNKDYWIVKKGFIYYIDDSYTSYIYVPRGYLTDGASVPRLFWNILPPWGHYGQSCVLHDYLCEYNYYNDGDNSFKLTRKKVNKIFDESMIVLDVPKFKRKVLFNGVEIYRKIINNGFDPLNHTKAIIEQELRRHRDETGFWK